MNEIIYCGGDVIGMIQLDILAVGNLERDEEGNILEANSTSVLIRTPDRLIVVDPSTDYMKPMVKSSFRQIGVFPKDVDTVILTHAHRDHVENLRFYKNAKVYIHSGASAACSSRRTDAMSSQATRFPWRTTSARTSLRR